MTRVIAFRRHALNRNSFAPLAAALDGAGLEAPYRIVFADQLDVAAQADLVCFSWVTPELDGIRAEVLTLRSQPRPPLLLAGGGHPSADPEGTLRLGFDAVFVGEAEETFPAYVRAWLERGVLLAPIQRPCRIFDLDRAIHAAPAHGLFPFVEIARGCPFGCAFCHVSSTFGRTMRTRSPAVVAAGIREAVLSGHTRFRFLTPDAFAYGKPREAEAIAELLARAREAGAHDLFLGCFPSEVRPDHVEPALLRLLAETCRNRTVVMGAQSGSDRVLGLMHRGHSVEHARRAARLIAEAGLIPYVDVLFCFPGEAPEDRLATLELMDWLLAHTGARLHAHFYLPLPGTSAWPAPAERLEPVIRDRLRALERAKRLTGDWHAQAAYAARIERWRSEGVICV